MFDYDSTRVPSTDRSDHIVHWVEGGPTSPDNLVLLCRRHHTLTHTTPWAVHLPPTDPTAPDPRRLRWSGRVPRHASRIDHTADRTTS